MLYLRSLTSHADLPRLPLADGTAEALEHALLALDRDECVRVLTAILEEDPAFAEWARREITAEFGESAEAGEVAGWWSEGLATKLVARIEHEERPLDEAHIEHRLPALVSRLHEFERQLATFDERLERDKLEALKELAYGAGHEVNNPLANIAARSQLLLADEADPERRRKLTAIHRQAMRAHEMIADLMLFARPPKLAVAKCDLGAIVRQVVGELAERAAERSIAVTCDVGDSPVVVPCDATQIAVAIAAVINNAIEAVRVNGRITVTIDSSEVAGERWAEVTVRDDGPGISPEVRRHLFDPFFSGREAGRGLGFGLSKCWRVVTDHGGRVVVNNVPSGGAEFTISLPAHPPAV